jgi:hypothetical protein
VSEFSESWHLVADDEADGAALLDRAGVAGWVFPASGGWVTIVPEASFGQGPHESLPAANTGLLAHYVHAEDHGWQLDVWAGRLPVGSQEVEWTEELDVRSRLDADRLADAVEAARPEPPLDRTELRRLLEVDEASLESMLMSLRSPAPQVAALLGWGEYDWLSGDYLADDGAEEWGARRIG